MKNIFYKILGTLFFTLSSGMALEAQAVQLGQSFNGEQIVGSAGVRNANGEDADVIVTAHNIYIHGDHDVRANTQNSLLTFGVTYAGVCLKAGTNNTILVMLSNGKVFRLTGVDANNIQFQTTTSLGTVSSTGSVNWEKCCGDAYYALSSNDVHISHNNGATWLLDTTGLHGAHVNDIDVDSSMMAFASTDHGIYKQDSTTGASWSLVSSFTLNNNLWAIYTGHHHLILASGNGGGVYISQDGGATWNMDSTGIGNHTIFHFTEDVYGHVYAQAGNALFKSTAGGGPWQPIQAGILALTQATPAFTCISADSFLVAGSNMGAFRSSSQGNSWVAYNEGIITEQYASLVKLSTNQLFASNCQGISQKDLTDTLWTHLYPQAGMANNLPLFADGADHLFVQDHHLNPFYSAPPLMKSTNAGQTWAIDSSGLYQVKGDLFYIDELNTQHYGNTYYGSSYYNQLWKRASAGVWTIDTAGWPVTNQSATLCMMSDHLGYLYASGYIHGQKVMRRPIGGGTWVSDTMGIPSSVSYFNRMASGNHGELVAGNSFYLFRRSAGTWTQMNLPSALSFASPTALSEDSSGNIFSAFSDFSGDHGVYYSADHGVTWQLAGLDGFYVNQLISYNDTTYALTNNGAYELTATPFTGISGPEPAIRTSLLTSFPNPFSASTGIYYTLHHDGPVLMEVFDVTGKKVQTLVNEPQSSGRREADWNAGSVSAGIYFIRLQTGDGMYTGKVVKR